MILIFKYQIGISGGKIVKTFKDDEREIAEEYFEDCEAEALLVGEGKYHYELKETQ